MISNHTNQQKDNNKVKNMVQQAWTLQLSPISVTLMPSDQRIQFYRSGSSISTRITKSKAFTKRI